MYNKDEIIIVNQDTLAKKIYTVREQKVMLDFEKQERIWIRGRGL
ncbi:MAG: hypothetical protein ACOX4R_03535 [Lentihominibacter sp.]|jgi:hypothetical protein